MRKRVYFTGNGETMQLDDQQTAIVHQLLHLTRLKAWDIAFWHDIESPENLTIDVFERTPEGATQRFYLSGEPLETLQFTEAFLLSQIGEV